MTQEILIMVAILVAVILLTLSVSCLVIANVRVTKSSLYTVRQEETKNPQSYITEEQPLYGRLSKGMSSCQ